MNALQRKLEAIFCPTIDSALIAAIVSDYPDFDVCAEMLTSLANDANHYFDAEVLSENSNDKSTNSDNSDNKKRFPRYPEKSRKSSYNGFSTIGEFESSLSSVSIGSQVEGRDAGDGDSVCSFSNSGDEIPLDEEIGRLNDYVSPTDFQSSAEFLNACFPARSQEKIERLLREYPHDLQEVVDILLNEHVIESTYSLSPSPFDTRDQDYVDHSTSNYISEHRKKKRRKPKKSKNVIFHVNGHLSTSGHENSRPSYSFSPRSPASLPSTNSCPTSPKENCWKTFENQTQQLKTIFPTIPEKTIRSTLHAKCGNYPDTAQELISLCLSDPTGKQTFDDDLGALIDIFPNHRAQLLKEALGTANGSHQARSRNQTSIPGVRSSDVTLNNETSEDEYEDDPQYCRKKAREYMHLRNDAYHKAVVAFRNSKGHAKAGEGGIALHYSNEGRRFDSKMKYWDLRAARSSVKKKSVAQRDHNLIDLHGLSVNEALTVVKEGLRKWYSNGKTQSSLRPLKIVTGIGKHSPGGIAKLPPAISKMLAREGWDVVKCQGYFLVRGMGEQY